MKVKIISLMEKVLGIFDRAIDTISKSVSDPKQFLVSVLLVVSAVDILFMGQLGFVKMLFGLVNESLVIIKSGGWQLVVIVLVVVLLKK